MANEVTLRLRVTSDGLEVFDVAGRKLDLLNDKATRASGKGAGGGLGGLFQSFKDIEAGINVFTGATKGAVQFAEKMNELGTNSIRARSALDILSGGKADEYLSRASKATRGLVGDMTLAQNASKALGLHIVQNSQEFADLVRIGNTLGLTFRGSATEGVETLTVALTRVGLTGLLDNIGISGERVKNKFEALKKTLGESEAWKIAVLEEGLATTNKLEGAMDKTGEAVQRLQIKWDNFTASVGRNIAIGIEGTINGSEAIFNYYFGGPNSPGSRAALEQNKTPGQKTVQDAIRLNTGAAGMSVSDYDAYMRKQAPWAYEPLKGPLGPMGAGGGSMAGTALDYMLGRAPSPGSLAIPVGDAARARNAAVNRMSVMQRPMATGFELPGAGTLRGADERAFMDFQRGQEGWNAALRITDQLTAGIRGNMEAGLGTLRELTEQERKRASIQSVAQAFGLRNDGLYGEIGGDIGEALAGARAGVVKTKGMKGAAQFDKSAKAALDEYALATGSATKESLKFRDAKEQLSASLSKGTINVDQYVKGMLALANAAKNSRTSMDELMTVMALTPGLQGKETAAYFGAKIQKTAQAKKLARMEGMDEGITLDALGLGKVGARPGSEFEDTLRSAQKARAMVHGLRDEAPTTGVALALAGGVAAGGLLLATNQAAALRRELEALASMSINVPVNIGGGNPPTGGRVNPTTVNRLLTPTGKPTTKAKSIE